MRRFLVDPQQIVEDKATLAGRQAHHLHRVLRLKAGDAVVLTDGSGHALSLIHISEPTRPFTLSRMPSSA